MLSDGMRVLLDASLDPDTLLEIRETILGDPAVSEVKWVTGRNAGRFRFVEAEAVLRVQDLDKAEAATRRVETEIRRRVPHIERVLIHTEPMARTHLRYAAPLVDPGGTLSEHFGEAPYFALIVVRLADGQVEAQQILTNPYQEEERAKGIRVAEWLVAQKVDIVLVKQSLQGKGPVYVFGDAGIELRQTDASTLDEAVEMTVPDMPV